HAHPLAPAQRTRAGCGCAGAFQSRLPIMYEEIFGPEGPLARTLAGFATRAEQIAMAQHVDRALHAGGRLIVEAGTGTGKTFAYLAPALHSGRRVIVSTGTR